MHCWLYAGCDLEGEIDTEELLFTRRVSLSQDFIFTTSSWNSFVNRWNNYLNKINKFYKIRIVVAHEVIPDVEVAAEHQQNLSIAAQISCTFSIQILKVEPCIKTLNIVRLYFQDKSQKCFLIPYIGTDISAILSFIDVSANEIDFNTYGDKLNQDFEFRRSFS